MRLNFTLAIGMNLAAVILAAPAAAANPEQVQDLGPDPRKVSVQYIGQAASALGTDEEREHSGQLLYGLSEKLALGSDVQLKYQSAPEQHGLSFEHASGIALVRFSDSENDPVGLGLWVQASVNGHGELAVLEGRFIAEKKTRNWWLQANTTLRRVNDQQEEGSYLAYSARVSHALGKDLWLGVETSGQPLRLSGFRRSEFDGSTYLGPTIYFEKDLGDTEAQVGISYLRRLDEHDPLRDVLQLSVQLTF
jgi:hypothetical protein